jgi:N-acetyl-gamma-glutamyl-phosphate reductase
MKVTVLGATGYTGMLLLRILAHHPSVREVIATSRRYAGKTLSEVDPGLSPLTLETGRISSVVRSLEEAISEPGDVVFSALPHGASAEACEPLLGRTVVIDLSADFRFRDPRRFESAYGHRPPLEHVQHRAVYGLCEVNREQLRSADIIANPGCYPTATVLPLLPFLPDIKGDTPIVVNAMSGITGAGKKEQMNLLYAERTENAAAYNPGRRHRHAAEIAEQLGSDNLLFTPHLVPLKQGMLVTTVVTPENPALAAETLAEYYRDEPFVTLTGSSPPETRHVRGTNEIRIGCHREGDQVVLMSAIDNLWKGAAGQAVQNMNIRFGIAETTGLLRDADL